MVKKATKVAENTEAEETENEEFYNAEDLNPALLTMYAECGIDPDEADTTVHVAKLDYDGKGTEANVWKGTVDQYDLFTISRQFGTGAYRVMVYTRIPSGQKVRKVNKTMHQMLSPDDEARLKSMRDNPTLPTAPNQSHGLQLADVSAMIAESMKGVALTLENALLKSRPAETDPLKTLEGIKQIAELVKPASAPVDSFQQTMKGVELFMGMQERIKGPAAPITDDGELSLPAMFMLFMKQMSEMKKAAPVPVETPNPALPAPTQSTADEIKMQEDMDEMNILLKWQLKQANAAAKAGADPAEYAETIYPILPDPIFDFLTNDPKWFESVTAQVPECKQYEAWYMKVRESLIAFALEDSKENTAAPLTPETKSPTVVGITQSGENIVGNNSGTNPNG